MADALARAADWMSDVLEWLRDPITAMPTDLILQRLPSIFDINLCSWNWREDRTTFGMITTSPEIFLEELQTLEVWKTGDFFDCHALITWFELTRNTAPQTMARVPSHVVPRKRRILLERPLSRMGLAHQLSVMYRGNGFTYQTFVMARSDRDFSDDDLLVAGYVQRSLVTLDRQARVLQHDRGRRPSAVVDLDLTGRELAVLILIADGHSTRTAARQLRCSPRTVEKHLEHSFRKLGVRDRLNAIRVARLAGVVDDARSVDVSKHPLVRRSTNLTPEPTH